jgi:hypothetical protein
MKKWQCTAYEPVYIEGEASLQVLKCGEMVWVSCHQGPVTIRLCLTPYHCDELKKQLHDAHGLGEVDAH